MHYLPANMYKKLLYLVAVFVVAQGFAKFRLFPTSVRNLKQVRSGKHLCLLDDTLTNQLKVLSFNIWAPCYKRIASEDLSIKKYESDDTAMYLHRNAQICDKLLETDADVMCIQEFWSANEELRALYEEKLCNSVDGKYSAHYIDRTSHWRARKDGLAIFVKKQRIEVEDVRGIYFHDCGDRVALLLLLSILPSAPHEAKRRFITVNTHLLFPHNEYSSKIRLREVTKILGYIEAYKQHYLCTTKCSRDDVKLPIIIAGDFNGSPRGGVYKFITSQQFQPALLPSLLSSPSDPPHPTPSISSKPPITHRSHRGDEVYVDHIFYLNPPQDNASSALPPLPDWTNLVYYELAQKLLVGEGGEGRSMREVFGEFDADDSHFITQEEFRVTLEKLGFLGEGEAALTNEEIQMILQTADKNQDGMIDYKEFCDRFWLAIEMMTPPSPAASLSATPLSPPFNSLSAPPSSPFLPPPLSPDPDTLLFSPLEEDSPSPLSSSLYPTSSLPPKGESLVLTSRRFSYARRGWLEKEEEEERKVGWDGAEPLAGLEVQRVSLFPPSLEEGRWPGEFNLSDHGMVQVIFNLKAKQV